MTISTTYVPLDMENSIIIEGTVKSYSDTKIVIVSGDFKAVYRGTFTYDVSGTVSGQLNSVRAYTNGVLQQKATQIGIDIADLNAAGAISGDAFYSLLFGGHDELYGSDGADVLLGYDGFDFILGNGGADTIYGGKGGDLLVGQKGNDKLYGEKGGDSLAGENGSDKLYGGGGADYLWGGKGNDKLFGGSGDDWLLGGAGPKIDWYDQGPFGPSQSGGGNDVLRGGAGSDTFVFISSGGVGTTSTIKDFTDGEDLLNLTEFGITTAKQAKSYATNVNGDVVFDFGSDDILIVENFVKSDLSAADFTWEDFFGA